MFKKLQIALLVPFVFAWLFSLYRLNSSPAPKSFQRNETTPETPSQPASFPDADFAAHIEQLKKKLPSADFTIVIQPPFVVIGDESPEVVKEHSVNTVKWAVDKLKLEFFSQDPEEILDIWLFKDASSYEKNT